MPLRGGVSWCGRARAGHLCSVFREHLRALLRGRPYGPAFLALFENSIASTSIFVLQATKSQRWMPWRLKPMKDVGGCDKPRGAADQASIRGCPNGETRHPSWGVTLA